MKTTVLSPLVATLLTLIVLGLSGCDVDYWWSRGKPPTSEKLLSLSHSKLDDILTSTVRSEVKGDVARLEKLLVDTHSGLKQGVAGDKLKGNLAAIRDSLYGLEGRLSYGSRPAYGELVGQLRGFEDIAKENGTVDTNVFTLYSARVFFFLSDELGVPAPVGSQAS
jgi:hypothetical protein